MKCFLKRVMLMIILSLIIITLPIGTLLTRADGEKTEPYEMKITSGIEGKYRALKYVPVIVEFTSFEKDFNGEVEIRVAREYSKAYDAYSKEISVAKGEKAKIIIPINILEGSSKITANLIENEKVLYEKKSLISSGRINEANLFMGILTDDATSLSYTASVPFDNSRGVTGTIEKVQLDKDIIGESNLNIDGLDVIIINNYNMSNFKKEQYEALNSWINKGGTLIIGSGANESKTISAIDNNFLDIKSSGSSEKNIKLVDENLNLIVSNLKIKDGKLKEGTEENPILYSMERGKGKILVSTFDLGLEPFISSKDTVKFLSSVLQETYNEITGSIYGGNGKYMPGYYRSRELYGSIPVNEVVGVKSLATVLSIYALIIGVVLYIVLKKLNKRDFTWIAIPLISVIFTLGIYFMGSKTRVKDVILNQNNIISVDKDGKGTAKGYVGIGTKYNSSMVIQKPEDVVMNYSVDDNGYYTNEEDSENKVLRVKTTYNGNNSYFTFNNSSALELKNFDVYGKEQVISTIESSFSLSDGKLNGKVKNNLDGDIKTLLLVAGRNIWEIGTLNKGEEKEISNLDISGANGLQAYSDTLAQKYHDARWKKDKDLKSEEFKGILRTSSLISAISNDITSNSDVKLIAITDLPVEYGIEFREKSISKFDTTAIVQDTKLDFKDKDGFYNFPDGYFEYSIDSISNNVHLDEYNGGIYGQGDVVFKFEIDKNIEISDLIIKQGTDRYGYGNEDNAEKYIYNYKTGNYDKFTGSQGSEKVQNLSDYINNNEVKVKFIVDDVKGGAMIPMISVKGRGK